MFQKLCLDKDYLRQVFSFIIYNKIVDNLDSQIEMLEELFPSITGRGGWMKWKIYGTASRCRK